MSRVKKLALNRSAWLACTMFCTYPQLHEYLGIVTDGFDGNCVVPVDERYTYQHEVLNTTHVF